MNEEYKEGLMSKISDIQIWDALKYLYLAFPAFITQHRLFCDEWYFDATLLDLQWLETTLAHDPNSNPLCEERKLQQEEPANLYFDH
jgi:hypothetical protein